MHPQLLVVNGAVDGYVDVKVKLKATTDEELADLDRQRDNLKEALKAVLLNRNVTKKKAKDDFPMSKSTAAQFEKALRVIKHNLVQLLGDKQMRPEVAKKIEELKRDGRDVTFKVLWRDYGGNRVSEMLGFLGRIKRKHKGKQIDFFGLTGLVKSP